MRKETPFIVVDKRRFFYGRSGEILNSAQRVCEIDSYLSDAALQFACGKLGVQISFYFDHHKKDAVGILFVMVGAARFELATSWSRTRRATELRYTPNKQWSQCRDSFFAIRLSCSLIRSHSAFAKNPATIKTQHCCLFIGLRIPQRKSPFPRGALLLLEMEPMQGFEPWTCALRMRCSTC